MLTNQNHSESALLSSFRASIHETGTVTFTGNPFQDLAQFGIIIHGATINYFLNPNATGNTVTGHFNLTGRIETAGSTSYESLILFVVRKWQEHQEYYRQCRHQKTQARHARRQQSKHLLNALSR